MIPHTITVLDSRSQPLSPTYRKRARQLVKQGRARWLTEDTIGLTGLSKEDVLMEAAIPSASCVNEPVQEQAPAPAEETVFDNPALLDLAKQRMAAKRNLMGQALDYLLFLIPLIAVFYDYYLYGFFMFPALYWGIRLIVRVIKFYRPDFKNGVRAYFQKRRQLKLEFEYKRLKAMGVSESAGDGARLR